MITIFVRLSTPICLCSFRELEVVCTSRPRVVLEATLHGVSSEITNMKQYLSGSDFGCYYIY